MFVRPLILIYFLLSPNLFAKPYGIKETLITPEDEENLAIPMGWHKKDLLNDYLFGTSSEFATAKFSLPFLEEEFIIAVIDTGVNIDLPELKNQIWTNPKDGTHGWNFLDQEKCSRGSSNVIGDDPEHGTIVAGVIAAYHRELRKNNLLLPQIKIMPLVVNSSHQSEKDKDVISAIYFAVNHGAKILNLSFGKDSSENPQGVQKALHYAQKNNVLIVQAAGNTNYNLDRDPSYPSPYFENTKLHNYLRVAAATHFLDESLLLTNSNYGKNSVDFMAPGYLVSTTSHQGNYVLRSGTSIAAAVTSSIAATLWAYAPHLTPAEIIELLKQGAMRVPSQKVPIRRKGRKYLKDILMVPGVINLYNSLEILTRELNNAPQYL